MAKILVIDDCEDVRDLMVKTLQEHEVYVVDNWAKSFPYIFEKEIDLILVDINMPGLTGDKIAGIIKEKVQNQSFKVVLFSAMDKAKLRKLAKESSVDGCIVKVFDNVEKLIFQINKYLP